MMRIKSFVFMLAVALCALTAQAVDQTKMNQFIDDLMGKMTLPQLARHR